MFNLFKKKEIIPPDFNGLKNSPIKDKYFRRTARWWWMDKQTVCVKDPNAPRMITMDTFPQTVFLHAEGEQTVEEFILEFANAYRKGKIPPHLDLGVIEAITEQLEPLGLIELVDEPSTLADEYLHPMKF